MHGAFEPAASAEGGPAYGTALYSSGSRWVLALPGTLRIPPVSFKSLHPKVFRTFFSIFWPSKKCFKICFEKMTKKVRKSRFSATQNPPKILPKRLRNRCSNKQAIFHRFLLQRASVAKAPTSILYWFLQYKMALGRFSSCCFLHGFGIQKTIQKPIKNHARATQKSISKTCCFLISIFSHFGLDFGGSWASNLEPSWLKIPPPRVK